MNKKSQDVMVVGANGFLGQNLVYWLLKNNFEVLAVDRQKTLNDNESISQFNLNYIQSDLTKAEEVNKLPLSNTKAIYMFVALTGTKDGFSDYDKYIETNQITLLNVLSAYVKQKSKARLVFPSSRLVYKGIKDKFLKEDSVKETNTVYAVNKLACEAYLKCWGNAFDVSYTIYRICVPFGQLLPGNYSYGTLGFMTRQAKQNALISLYGDGKQKRTFTHVADICEILGRFSFLKESQNLTINIGSNDNIDMNTLANMLATKFKAQVTHKPWPEMDFKIESGDTMFDDSLLQSLQHFEYKGTLANFLNG